MALISPEEFRDRILEIPGFVEPDSQHHGFADGDHGKKVDAGVILPGMPEYEELVGLTALRIMRYKVRPNAILGVANGTSEIVFDISQRVKEIDKTYNLQALATHKRDKKVYLSDFTKNYLKQNNPNLLIFDDVGTTGSTTAELAEKSLESGARTARVLYIILRQAQLRHLHKKVAYDSVIPGDLSEELPTYSPKECRKIGYCVPKKECKFIPHGE